jgi:dihydropteroate synthase
MTKLHDLNQKKSMLIKGKLIDLSEPKIMAILNVTPDSFYRESRSLDLKEILNKAEKMIMDGADVLDIGGISTRPGAIKISSKEEIERIEKPLIAIRKEFPETIISLDTFHAHTSKIGLEIGADIINDVSNAQIDGEIIDVVAANKVPYVLTHSFGMADQRPENEMPKNIVHELINFFSSRINWLHSKGIYDIVIDPGFGFGKTLDHNFEIISGFEALKILGKPILVGISRKSMISKKLETSSNDSLSGTIALNSLLLKKGATIFRVHDVKEMNQIRTLLNYA